MELCPPHPPSQPHCVVHFEARDQEAWLGQRSILSSYVGFYPMALRLPEESTP